MTRIFNFLGSRTGLIVCLALAVLGVYLLVNHTGHLLTALPYLFLVACPLMHFFGHGHRHHQSPDAEKPGRQS